jgi:PAS domain S-box-containing protein
MKKEQKFSRSPSKLIILYLLITSFVLIIGIRYYYRQKEEIRNEAYTNLSVIAELKAKQISNWRNERIGDANVIFSNKYLITDLKKWFDNPNNTILKSTINSHFSAYCNFYHYEDIIIFDSNATVKYSIDEKLNKLSKISFNHLKKAVKEKKPVFSEIYLCDLCNDIHLDIIIPLFEKDILFGGIILRIDPNEFLFPLIQSWPTISQSSETLLITKDGDEVVYLNELRHQKNTALKLRFKIDSSNYNIPAVMAAMGKTGLVEGLDYRGIPVLSDIREISDSRWYMVAKVDLDEIYAPVKEKAFNISILCGLVLISFAIGFIWVWANQKKSIQIQHLEEERKHQALIKHFDYIVKYANDIIILSDNNLQIKEVNQRALDEYGYTKEEMLNMKIPDLLAPESHPIAERYTDSIELEKGIIYESVHKRKDNSIFPIEASVRIIEIDGKKYFQRIIRDISERKKAEELIRESEAKFRSLFENAILGIYRTTPEGKIIDCNPALLKMLGFDSPEDLSMRNLEEYGFKPGYSRSEFKKKIETEGEILGLESAWIKKDGTSIFVNENAKAVKDKDGKFLFYEGTVEDITKRKKMEVELQVSENKYRRLHESMMDGFALVDMQGEILDFNESFQKMLGYNADELKKLSYSDITPHKWHEYEQKIVIEQILKFGYSDVYEKEYRKKDGTIIQIELRTFLLKNEAGENEGMWGIIRDISERKHAEEALQESKQIIQNVIDNSPSLIYLLDLDGKFKLINKKLETVLGISQEKIIGNTRNLFMPQEIAEQHRNNDLVVINSKKPLTFEEINTEQDSLHYYLTVKFPLFDSSGNVYALGGISTNITERKHAEEVLRESERKLREAQEMAHLGYWHWDIKTGNVEWSEEVYKIFRLNPKEFTPQIDSIQALSPWPEENQRDKELINKAIESHKPGFYEQKFLRPDKSIGYYSSTFQGNYSEKGELITIVGAVMDITERKQAEEVLIMQKRIGDVFLTNPDDEMFNEVLKVILEVMQSPFGVFGYIDENGALVVPTMTRQIWDKCDVPEKSIVFPRDTWGDSSWPRAVREKKPNYSNEISNKTPEGHVTLMRHISLPIIFQEEVVGLFQVANKVTDYTEADINLLGAIAGYVAPVLNARLLRQNAEEKIRKLNEELEQRVIERTSQLEQSNKELEAFSYSVSHDLRAPLRSIDGFSLALFEDYHNKLDDKAKDYLSRIRNSTLRMDELIDSMLKLSRVTRFEIRYSEVNLSKLAFEIVENIKNENKKRKSDFIIKENIFVEGDKYLLGILLENLINNAWKFTGKKEKTIIELGTFKKDSNTVYFIRDNGTGFDMKYYDKLFGAFQRLHSKKDFPGTGIGLATAQRIVHRHSGKIWAESEIDKGTTFYFTLK